MYIEEKGFNVLKLLVDNQGAIIPDHVGALLCRMMLRPLSKDLSGLLLSWDDERLKPYLKK
jgi:hypothetical protein